MAICPHCGASRLEYASFCEACGKALPDLDATGPRIVTADTTGASAIGRELLAAQLAKQVRKSSTALLVVAVLQLVASPFLLEMIRGQLEVQPGQPAELPPITYVTIYGIAAVFFALWLWSRFNPLAASIIGLVLYVSLHLLDALADPATISNGLLVKVIVVVILVRGILAGAKHRRLLNQEHLEVGR